jgi:hypothetical protein
VAQGHFLRTFSRGGDEIALLERHLNDMSVKIRDNSNRSSAKKKFDPAA